MSAGIEYRLNAGSPVPQQTAQAPNVQELLSQAQAHLRNAQELAERPVGKADLVYMWDNQITALDNYLANTEGIPDGPLAGVRRDLLTVKKKLMDSVVAFEAKEAGEEIPPEPETESEWIEFFIETAGDMTALVAESLEQKVKDVQELSAWEEPLAIVNGYLADSEPFAAKSKDLQKARAAVRAAKGELESNIRRVFEAWRKADLAGGRGDEDDED